MHPKLFRVAWGYEVVKGFVTYGAGLVVDVERDEWIEIFAASAVRVASIGRFNYAELMPARPPRGLLVVD